MKEKVIENWLINSTERTFQAPFCFSLLQEGQIVIHSSRHCAMELGKDVISVAQDGIPQVFQLKTGNISISQWREINTQIIDICYGSIEHPSLESNGTTFQPWLVTNGVIEEEVARAIGDFNKSLEKNKKLPLKTITKYELLKKILSLEQNLWPVELADINLFLEMHLEDGREQFPREKFCSLLESTLPLTSSSKPSRAKCKKAISSVAILTASVLNNFSKKNNYFAEIEAWVIFCSYSMALAEKWQFDKSLYTQEVEMAINVIYDSLIKLAVEAVNKEVLIEGDVLFDHSIYPYRITLLLGLMGILGLWKMCIENQTDKKLDEQIREFIFKYRNDSKLWGEAAIPQILACYWYLKKNDGTTQPDKMLSSLISAICSYKSSNNPNILPDPYYKEKDLIPYVLDQKLSKIIKYHDYKMSVEPFACDFKGNSNALEGIIYMFTRLNWKQTMKILWPLITRVTFHRFEFKESWHFYRWQNETGKNISIQPKHRKSWTELKQEAIDSINGVSVPKQIKDYPFLLMLFLIIFPHRISSDSMNWLDDFVKEIE